MHSTTQNLKKKKYILANTGGLLSLFMGFSVVSVSEIFYFIALRPYCRRFINRDNLKMKFTKSTLQNMSNASKFNEKHQSRNWPPIQSYERANLDDHINQRVQFYKRNF